MQAQALVCHTEDKTDVVLLQSLPRSLARCSVGKGVFIAQATTEWVHQKKDVKTTRLLHMHVEAKTATAFLIMAAVSGRAAEPSSTD